MSDNTMAYILRNVREMRGLSQQDVANMLNKTQNAIYNWEAGKTSPPADDIADICKLYKITPNDLFGWSTLEELREFVKTKKELAELDNQIEQLQARKAALSKELKKQKSKRRKK